MAKPTALQIPDQELEQQMLEARGRGLRRRSTQPFTLHAAYNPELQRIEVELSNGFAFSFPPSLFAELAKGTPDQLAHVEVDQSGYVLHWSLLDADYDVSGMVQVALGAKEWISISEIGRLGGRSTSPAKRAAAILNGTKGGRPPLKRRGRAKKRQKASQKLGSLKMEQLTPRRSTGRKAAKSKA
jgi:hypothetical protein